MLSIITGIMRHNPRRHGVMQAPSNQGPKYIESARPPTDAQLAAHLAGTLTLATPATTDGQASAIVYDIDSQAWEAIPALLMAADRRGLFAYGELHEERDRGYVWVPFDQPIHAEALRQFGDQIAGEALADIASWRGLAAQPAPAIDNRTSNNAITRLPFGRHTHTGQRGLIVLADGRSAHLDHEYAAASALLIENYRENSIDSVPRLQPATPKPAMAPTSAPQPKQRQRPADSRTNTPSNAEIKALYNQTIDICEVLARHGGRRHSRTSWHCPCGRHANRDASPSLLISTSKRPQYGPHVVMGYAPHCAFHSASGEVWDAFNVEMLLAGRTYPEQIAHARQVLGHPLNREGGAPKPRPSATPTARPTAPQSAPKAAQCPETVAKIREATIMRAALDAALRVSDRKVLAALLEIAGEKAWCRPSIATIADRAQIHQRTAQAAVKRLQDRGYITISPAANRYGGTETNIYTLQGSGGGVAELPPELKLNACKGGAFSPAAADPAPAPAVASPHPAAVPATPAPAAAPPAPIPATAQPEPELDDQRATFDPDQCERYHSQPLASSWRYNRSPREVKHSHEYIMAERQGQRPAPPASEPTPAPQLEASAPALAIAAPSPQLPETFELAVLRDAVDRLRAAAIKQQNGQAWAIYHRERRRLVSLEQRMIGRAEAAASAPPARKGRRPQGAAQQLGLEAPPLQALNPRPEGRPSAGLGQTSTTERAAAPATRKKPQATRLDR